MYDNTLLSLRNLGLRIILFDVTSASLSALFLSDRITGLLTARLATALDAGLSTGLAAIVGALLRL